MDVGTAADGKECSAPVTTGPAVDAIRALEEMGAEGNTKGMTREAGERLFWPEYVAVAPDGKMTTKNDMLADWQSAPWASLFKVQDLSIQVHCDTSIVIGSSEVLWIGAPQNAKPLHFRWLNVWTRRNGEWRMSATQFVRF
jgi:hypothetical protein